MDRIGLLRSEGDSPAVNAADFDLDSSANGRLSEVAFRTADRSNSTGPRRRPNGRGLRLGPVELLRSAAETVTVVQRLPVSRMERHEDVSTIVDPEGDPWQRTEVGDDC